MDDSLEHHISILIIEFIIKYVTLIKMVHVFNQYIFGQSLAIYP